MKDEKHDQRLGCFLYASGGWRGHIVLPVKLLRYDDSDGLGKQFGGQQGKLTERERDAQLAWHTGRHLLKVV